MSHAALIWLSTVPAERMTPSEFRVLFHLCNCHNSKTDLCNPTQALLALRVGAARSTINAALAGLEKAGLIIRHQTVDDARRQRPTFYTLAMADAVISNDAVSGGSDTESEKPCSKSGDSRVLSTGHGAVSEKQGEPCPKSGQSRVRPTGHKPVNKSKNNPRGPAPTHEGRREAASPAPASIDDLATFWAKPIAEKKFVAPGAISVGVANRIIEMGLCQPSQLRAAGIAF